MLLLPPPLPFGRTLESPSGYRFTARPTVAGDADALGRLFAAMSPEDLRFRFLTPCAEVPASTLAMLARTDVGTVENFIAHDPAGGAVIGSATLASEGGGEGGGDAAELAIAVHPDWRGRGIGWAMVGMLIAIARVRGFRFLHSIEARDNRAVIGLHEAMGYRSMPMPGEPGLLRVEVDLTAPAPPGRKAA